MRDLRRALFLTRAERYSPRAAAQIVTLERKVAELEAQLNEAEDEALVPAGSAR
jgi:hypothetical protein